MDRRGAEIRFLSAVEPEAVFLIKPDRAVVFAQHPKVRLSGKQQALHGAAAQDFFCP